MLGAIIGSALLILPYSSTSTVTPDLNSTVNLFPQTVTFSINRRIRDLLQSSGTPRI